MARSRKKEPPSKISSTRSVRNRRTISKKGSKITHRSDVQGSRKKTYVTAKSDFKSPNIKSSAKKGNNLKKAEKGHAKRGNVNKINSEGESSINPVSENEVKEGDAESAFEHWMSLFHPSSSKSKDITGLFHIYDGEFDFTDECSCAESPFMKVPLVVKDKKLPPSCAKRQDDGQPSCSKDPDIELPSEECSTDSDMTSFGKDPKTCKFCGKRFKPPTSLFETEQMKGYMASCLERVEEAKAARASWRKSTMSADEDLNYCDEFPLQKHDPETLTGFERFVLVDLPNMSSDDDLTIDSMVNEELINEHFKKLNCKEELSKNMTKSGVTSTVKGVMQKNKSAKTKNTNMQTTPMLIKEDKIEQEKSVEKGRRANKRGQEVGSMPKSTAQNCSKPGNRTVKKAVSRKVKK